MPPTLDAIRNRVQNEAGVHGLVGDGEDISRLRTHERQELVDLLAQGGMPRLFWAGVEAWVNEKLRHRAAGYTVHLVR